MQRLSIDAGDAVLELRAESARDAAAASRIVDAVAASLRDAGGDNPMQLPMSAHVFTAMRS